MQVATELKITHDESRINHKKLESIHVDIEAILLSPILDKEKFEPKNFRHHDVTHAIQGFVDSMLNIDYTKDPEQIILEKISKSLSFLINIHPKYKAIILDKFRSVGIDAMLGAIDNNQIRQSSKNIILKGLLQESKSLQGKHKTKTIIDIISQLPSDMNESERFDILRKKYREFFKEKISDEELAEHITGQSHFFNKSGETHYETRADGQCVFHAVFGKEKNNIYEVGNPQLMRDELCLLLSSFNSLSDPTMPKKFSDSIRNVLEHFFDRLEAAHTNFRKSEYIQKLRIETQNAIAYANIATKKLIDELIKVVFEKSSNYQKLLEEILLKILNSETSNDQSIKSALRNKFKLGLNPIANDAPCLKHLLKKEDSIISMLKSELKPFRNVLSAHIEQFARILNPETYNKEEFENKFKVEHIMKKFLYDEMVYKTYLKDMESSSYYIFMEEIPILASLSNRTINVWRGEAQGYYEIQPYVPDDASVKWIQDNYKRKHLICFQRRSK